MKWQSYCLLALCIAIVGCSKPTAEEYFSLAAKAQQEGERSLGASQQVQDSLYTIALNHYNDLLKEYPNSSLAAKSLFMIASIQHNGMHRFEAAVESYKKYYSTYPDSQQAPVALFLVGYLYNNELHNLDSAATAYTRFLEEYPSHEMVQSAKFELENLGKAADELLPKPAVAQTTSKKAHDKQPGQKPGTR